MWGLRGVYGVPRKDRVREKAASLLMNTAISMHRHWLPAENSLLGARLRTGSGAAPEARWGRAACPARVCASAASPRPDARSPGVACQPPCQPPAWRQTTRSAWPAWSESARPPSVFPARTAQPTRACTRLLAPAPSARACAACPSCTPGCRGDLLACARALPEPRQIPARERTRQTGARAAQLPQRFCLCHAACRQPKRLANTAQHFSTTHTRRTPPQRPARAHAHTRHEIAGSNKETARSALRGDFLQ